MGINNLEKNFVSVVVYVHNQATQVNAFIQGITGVLASHFEKFEVVFVDDCSTDDSVSAIRQAAQAMKGISVSIVHLSYRQGLDAAMIAGVDLAIGDFVYEIDSLYIDYEFEELMRVYRHALQGYDVVSASPRGRERLSSQMFYKVFAKYSKNNIQLVSERFRILSRRGINRISMLSHAVPYRKAIYFNCGLKAVALKYQPLKNAGGNRGDSDGRTELAIQSLLLFTDVGSKVALYMAGLMCALSFSMVIYTVYVYLTFARLVEGWTTLMLALSVSFTGLFALLAILIKYVSMILSMQHNKQAYVFEGVEKLKQ